MTPKTGFLNHFYACNQHDANKFRPFFIGENRMGWLNQSTLDCLTQNALFRSYLGGLQLAPHLTTFETRSAALAEAAALLAVHYNKKLRQEMYPILLEWGDNPLAQVDRSAVPSLGIRAFGIHVNGFVRKNSGIHLWIGERAHNLLMEPGMLDNMIGGGQPINLSFRENLRKEAKEEAGITDADLIDSAQHVRTLRYLLERRDGLRNDTLVIFDLELSEDFKPQNTDGEVAAFHLLPATDVADIVATTQRFKFNCNLVITDFLIRHGIIKPSHPEYQEIVSFLARDDNQHISLI